MKAPLPLYTLTLFLSALLLFLMEPMTAKMLLPFLGGAPAVWNTCMVFFQFSLLAGYAYAHASSLWLSSRTQIFLQAALLAAGFLFLPTDLRAIGLPPTAEWPVWWLIGALTKTIGLPFFVLSATGPLLQRWFSRTKHPSAKDPYFLYGASNLGSLMALLAFPVLIEPMLSLSRQTLFWTLSYGLLALCTLGCGWTIVRAEPGPATVPAEAGRPAPVAWRERFYWLALAVVPSSLLLGVTTYISADVAAVPLLWIVPLALYLLSFVITFARRTIQKPQWLLKLQVYLLIFASFPYVDQTSGWYRFLVNLACFFVIALVCHGELARRRPPVERLTEFYLWVSLGGVLGGIVNALVAPLIFSAVYEYPLMLALSCLLRRPAAAGRRFAASDLLWPLGLSAVLVVGFGLAIGGNFVEDHRAIGTQAIFLAICIVGSFALLSAQARPLALGLSLAVLFFVPDFLDLKTNTLAQERSFFGVLRVRLEDQGRFVVLMHGVTAHGAAFTDPARWLEPLAYYQSDGPAGQVFRTMFPNPTRNIGVMGLGTGALSCYRRPGETWTFYELDQAVEQLARDTRFLHFMSECGGDARVVLGDGRLSVKRAGDGEFDLLVLDAYSSDAIPVHLLTREALAIYLRKTAPDGVVLLHISNRHFNLLPVVGALVRDAGAAGLYQAYSPPPAPTPQWEGLSSLWVAVAKRESTLSFLEASGKWRPLVADPSVRVWTDDYSNVFSTIYWH
jgi:spermidine synthase